MKQISKLLLVIGEALLGFGDFIHVPVMAVIFLHYINYYHCEQ